MLITWVNLPNTSSGVGLIPLAPPDQWVAVAREASRVNPMPLTDEEARSTDRLAQEGGVLECD